MYFKSTYTGQCYRLDFIPKYGGYEPITEEEYFLYWKAMGMIPPEV